MPWEKFCRAVGTRRGTAVQHVVHIAAAAAAALGAQGGDGGAPPTPAAEAASACLPCQSPEVLVFGVASHRSLPYDGT